MIDLRGRKYSSMKYAFKYRKKLAPSCRCKELPWAQSEIIRHEQYAQDEADRGIKRVRLVRVASIKKVSTGKKTPAGVARAEEKKQTASGSPSRTIVASGDAGELKYWHPRTVARAEISAVESDVTENSAVDVDVPEVEQTAAVETDETAATAPAAADTEYDLAEAEAEVEYEYEDDSDVGPDTDGDILGNENVGIVYSRKRLDRERLGRRPGRERVRRQRYRSSASRMKQWWRNNRY